MFAEILEILKHIYMRHLRHLGNSRVPQQLSCPPWMVGSIIRWKSMIQRKRHKFVLLIQKFNQNWVSKTCNTPGIKLVIEDKWTNLKLPSIKPTVRFLSNEYPTENSHLLRYPFTIGDSSMPSSLHGRPPASIWWN